MRVSFHMLGALLAGLLTVSAWAGVSGARILNVGSEQYSVSFTYNSPLFHPLTDGDITRYISQFHAGDWPTTDPAELNSLTEEQILEELIRNKGWQIDQLQKRHPLFDRKKFPRMYHEIIDLLPQSTTFVTLTRFEQKYGVKLGPAPGMSAEDLRKAQERVDKQGILSSTLLGMLAVATVDKNGDLPMEKKPWDVRFERPDPVPLTDQPVVVPFWIPKWRELTGGKVMVGDIVQVNSLVLNPLTDHASGASVKGGNSSWPLMWFAAFTHGIFSTGRVIPKGESVTINGKTYDGPLALIPSVFVGECDGETLKRLYESKSYGFKVIGERPNPFIPGSTTYLLQTTIEDWVKNRPEQLKDHPGYRWVKEAKIGPFTIEQVATDKFGMASLIDDPLKWGESLESCAANLMKLASVEQSRR